MIFIVGSKTANKYGRRSYRNNNKHFNFRQSLDFTAKIFTDNINEDVHKINIIKTIINVLHFNIIPRF